MATQVNTLISADSHVVTQSVGTIAEIKGAASIVSASGVSNVAHVGDPVYLHDKIVVEPGGAVKIFYGDASTQTIENPGPTVVSADAAMPVTSESPVPVGAVAEVQGKVLVVNPDGSTHVLKVGDPIYLGQVLKPEAGGSVKVVFTNGTLKVFTGEIPIELTGQTIGFEVNQAQGDVAEIQRAILAGEDPSRIAEATAAGAGGGDDGGSTFNNLSLTGLEGIPTSGFPTGPIESGPGPIPEGESIIPETTTLAVAEVIQTVSPPIVTLEMPIQEERGPCLEEDSKTSDEANQIFIGATTSAGDNITQIVITGFDPNWSYDLSGLPGTASFDIGGTVLTISGLSGDSYSGILRLAPPADSDVDLGTLSAVATAVDGIDPTVTATGPVATLDVHVDANADPATIDISVADSNDDGFSFQANEDGTVTVNGTFGDFSDGSETHDVFVTIPDGFSVTDAAGGTLVPGGVLYSGVSGGIFNAVIGIEAGDLSAEGNYEFSATATATETSTGDEECDTSEEDNIAQAGPVRDDATIANVTAPLISLQLPEGVECLEEDSTTETFENQLAIHAETSAGDNLTQIVISGFSADWSYDLTGLGTASFDLSGTVLTITIGGGSTYDGLLKLAPPADSDIDLGLLSATVYAEDGVDPQVTASGNSDLYVSVDAIADPVSNVTISVTDAGGNGLFLNGESGTLAVTSTFGDFNDGSELHTVTVQLVSGFTAALSPSGSLGGASYTYNSATGTIVFTLPTGQDTLNTSFGITAPASGTLPQNLVFTATATADENPLADNECTTENNVVTVSVQTGIPSERLLSGDFVTNSNVQSQLAVVTFMDFNNPLHVVSLVYSLNAQGQQGSVVTDAGFNIDPSHQFGVVVESADNPLIAGFDPKIIVTDFSLEGITIVDSGNQQIELNNNTSGPDRAAFTSLITPNDATPTTPDQAATGSTDGDASGSTLTDGGGGVFNYLYGADGNDTLNGTSDADVLNGGNGVDILNGNGGNDILVYGVGDTHDGGADTDILRVDIGAVALSAAETDSPDVVAPTQQVVDLSGKAISNMEVILITEDALKDASLGTTIQLQASDVLNYTDVDGATNGDGVKDLYVIGSNGDEVQIMDPGNWVDGDTGTAGLQATSSFSDGAGQMFNVYTTTVGAELKVDQDVQVIT